MISGNRALLVYLVFDVLRLPQKAKIRKLSKIIYFVEGDVLYIADVWATRQDPNILAARFEK